MQKIPGAGRLATAVAAVWLVVAAGLAPAGPGESDAGREGERRAMVEAVKRDVARTSDYIGRDAFADRVLRAMARVPRHEFVPPGLREHAYENRPLPIGHGQTISQPYIVALMTDLLDPGPGDVALEVGTGSGYQAAVLAELVDRVVTMEIVPELAASAESRLERLGCDNVTVLHKDGYHGHAEHAPYDLIVVTAAADHIPPPLVEQLAPGARMVIPVGDAWVVQQLTLVEKSPQGEVSVRQLLPVSFVPLTGGH
jgi:protein-L-isoaspartate(D-aspartate) O-methyltransferase